MKKLVYTLGIIAASALAFSACQKEKASPEVQPEVETEVPVKMVTVSFTAEKVDAATKTQAVEGESSVSYEWTDGDVDNIKLFTVEAGALSAEVASPTITKVSPTSLTITTTVPENSTTTFRAILCKSDNYTGSGENYATRKPKIAVTQAPNGRENYDPNADILVSDDLEVTVGTGETSSGAMSMVFRRKVVVNKMTLKNMAEGEKVSKVVISSNKNLTGYLNGDSMTGQSTAITLNYDDVAVPDSGEFPVYFVTMENASQELTVTVTTNQFIYEKTFGPVTLTLGSFTIFGVGLPAGTPNSVGAKLPFEDNMAWANNGDSDSSTELTAATISTASASSGLYVEASKAYKGKGGLKLGTGSASGYVVTKDLDLSGDFYVAVEAGKYSSDTGSIRISVDNDAVETSGDFSEPIYVNIAAGTYTNKSHVTIATTSKRAYVYSVTIKEGTYVAPPKINVTSDNPMDVANTASSQTIEYDIQNETSATLTAALKESADWISNIDYSTAGEVTFDVEAQNPGDPERSAVIVLSYDGAADVEVEVNQAAGATSGPSASTLFLETFGSNASNVVLASHSDFSASQSMFTDPTNTVVSHYSSDGKVGKNTTNPSTGYSDASGNSAMWYTGTKNTDLTINLFTVDKIDIHDATELSVSFGLYYANGSIGSSNTVTAYYKIDNGEEQTLTFSQPASTGSWALCSGTITGTGTSLKIRFEQHVTAGYTARVDDVKVVGTK